MCIMEIFWLVHKTCADDTCACRSPTVEPQYNRVPTGKIYSVAIVRNETLFVCGKTTEIFVISGFVLINTQFAEFFKLKRQSR